MPAHSGLTALLLVLAVGRLLLQLLRQRPLLQGELSKHVDSSQSQVP
jgi:hypothetical protein